MVCRRSAIGEHSSGPTHLLTSIVIFYMMQAGVWNCLRRELIGAREGRTEGLGGEASCGGVGV